jgi:hypothetical protein
MVDVEDDEEEEDCAEEADGKFKRTPRGEPTAAV